MSTTIVNAVIAVLAFCFLIGVVAVWQTSRQNPLPAVEFSSPFRPDESPGGLNNEYISVKNSTDSPVDLSGWTVSNNEGDTFTFPDGFVLAAGGLITIYTGCPEDAEEALGLYWCAKEPVWGDAAGKASLHMPDGTLVDTHEYRPLCKTCGGN